MLKKLIITVLAVGTLATYAAESQAATTTTTLGTCVTRGPKVWKSIGGTLGLCIDTRVSSIRFDFTSDKPFDKIRAVITPKPPGSYLILKNKGGQFPPGQNPTFISWVFPNPLTCETGPGATLNVDGFYAGSCTVEPPVTSVPRTSYPKGLIVTKVLPQNFDVDICSVTGVSSLFPALQFSGNNASNCASPIQFNLPIPPIVGSNGVLGVQSFVGDVVYSDIPGPQCGNNLVETPEQCDDGNTNDWDGCSATCQIQLPVCGNSHVESGEQCDDGNTLDFDGCSATCLTQPSVCGNAHVESGEQCDDGNTLDFDGCSATCLTQPSVCGNAHVESGEQCDDGNTTNLDGCSSICILEDDEDDHHHY
jgi:cysteine-rich repeat protein